MGESQEYLCIDVSKKGRSPYSRRNQVLRLLWGIVYRLLFRPSPRRMHRWRIFLLKCFGANVTYKSRIYSTARVWAPWHLTMCDYACIAPSVDCYNAAPEINIDGLTGYNVDLDKPGELPQQLIELLKNADLLAFLGENGQQRWTEHFRYSAFKARFLPVLRDFPESV